MLLKLHSQLSHKSDSYHPPPPTSVTDKSIPPNFQCGDGAFYVGRLLDRLAKGSPSCYKCIVYHRLLIWPKAVVMQETATREDEEREQQERKRRARERKQQMMEEIEKEQRRFLDRLRVSESANSSESTSLLYDESVTGDRTSASTIGSGTTNISSLSDIIIDKEQNNSCAAKETRVQTNQTKTLTVDCIICNQTVVVQAEQQREDPVGLVILVQVCYFY